LLHYPRRPNPAPVNSSGDHDGCSDAQATDLHVREAQAGYGNNDNDDDDDNDNNNNKNNNLQKLRN
jgi:hypothetical protein